MNDPRINPLIDPRIEPGYDAVIVDLDGTLVDTVYQHVLAWQQSFSHVGLKIRGVDAHAAIGMGGDRLVTHVAGDAAEFAVGNEIRKAHDVHFRSLLHTVEELDGASDLLEALAATHRVVLASAAEEEITRDLLARVEGAHLLTGIVTGSDATSSKPSPDLLLAAAALVDSQRPIVLGDTTWDVRAAQAAGFACIGLTSGGISAHSLADAGAEWVYDGPRDLLASLARPLGS